MREVIKQGGGHFGITKDRSPFAEAEVRGDHDAGALVGLTQQAEGQRSARGAEGQVFQLVEDHEVELGHAFRDLASLTPGLSLIEGNDQFDGREKRAFRR